MRRTERLYALVDVLRARSPRPVSARRLAAEFEVSVRTIERDLSSLQAAGVPIYAEPGRSGGYCVGREFTLPPLRFTGPEALAVLAGLAGLDGSPFAEPARAAARKVTAALPADHRDEALALLDTVYFLEAETPTDPVVKEHLVTALTERRVVELTYRSVHRTRRLVEPLGMLEARGDWLLLAWCRLRSGVRGFRTDRIESSRLTDEIAPSRDPAVLREDLSRWRITRASGA